MKVTAAQPQEAARAAGTLLEVENLNKHFGGLHAVRNLAFSVRRWQGGGPRPMALPTDPARLP